MKAIIHLLALLYLVFSGKHLKARVETKKNRRRRRLDAYQRSHVWSEFWKGIPWYQVTHELNALANKFWWQSVQRGEDHKRKAKV